MGNVDYNHVLAFIGRKCTDVAIRDREDLSSDKYKQYFERWVGVSPDRFLSYIGKQYVETKLQTNNIPFLLNESELSSNKSIIINMTPDEYENGFSNLVIKYSYADTVFGDVLIASTDRGICCLDFVDDYKVAMKSLFIKFPNADIIHESNDMHKDAVSLINQKKSISDRMILHLKCTDFQFKVWNSLLQLPMGALVTYNAIAHMLGKPKASRAVGNAISKNLVAFLIPCHRVIRSSGDIYNYKWGSVRKKAMIGWEAVTVERLGMRCVKNE